MCAAFARSGGPSRITRSLCDPGNPAIIQARALRTGGFASPPFDGFAIERVT